MGLQGQAQCYEKFPEMKVAGTDKGAHPLVLILAQQYVNDINAGRCGVATERATEAVAQSVGTQQRDNGVGVRQ